MQLNALRYLHQLECVGLSQHALLSCSEANKNFWGIFYWWLLKMHASKKLSKTTLLVNWGKLHVVYNLVMSVRLTSPTKHNFVWIAPYLNSLKCNRMFILQIHVVMLETTAPLDTPIVLEQTPADLNWKFESNFDSDAPRYWMKLKSKDGIRYQYNTHWDYFDRTWKILVLSCM